MAAIPIISAGVSAVGTIAGIQQQSSAARAQANALDDERTNAIVQSKIASGEQKQQMLIAQTQAEVQRVQTAANFELAGKSAQLQREQYNSVVEQQRLALEAARINTQQQEQSNAAQLEQQRLQADNQLGQQQLAATNAINQAQQDAQTIPAETIDQVTQLAMAARGNRFTGTANAGTYNSLVAQNNVAQNNTEQLESDKEAINKFTEESLALNQQLEAAGKEQNKSSADIQAMAIASEQDKLNADVTTADRTLSEFQQALQGAISSNASDQQLNQLLLNETGKAQMRANELNLSAQSTRIDGQMAQIKRPGFVDLLNGGLSIFNTFNAMKTAQDNINTTQSKIDATNNRSDSFSRVSNPFYQPGISGQQQQNVFGLGVSLNNSVVDIPRASYEFSSPYATPQLLQQSQRYYQQPNAGRIPTPKAVKRK